ncbi:carbonic anhydrase [Algoriphagus sp. PAP.12]|uniref:carbonic anhydrase n=1 Tax=Algoriphagus sp. PAP.12 TaxID=2996678 RepID=UPI00227D1A85|nr:carbonic anhydrase [Algoriphagus sp. PAP.12]
MDLQKIFDNNEKWIEDKTQNDPAYFENLNKGQKPEVLYIGCSDSRVTAEDLMGMKPGELFVHRNVANVVNAIDLNAQSVINYAVTHLEVNHVVVCGHYSCGGVKAAMEAKDLGILNPWLRNIRDVYRAHKDELNSIEDEQKRYDRLVELNVKEQAINVVKMAGVQKAMRKRGMKIHGWVFDIKTGKLIDLKFDFQKVLEEIMEIYKLED